MMQLTTSDPLTHARRSPPAVDLTPAPASAGSYATLAASSLPPSVSLRDGRRLPVRRLVPDDKAEFAAAILRLSAQSRYQRFLAPRRIFTDRELVALTCVDGRRRDAVIALDPPPQRIVAVARYAELPDDPTTADIAITVGDPWQGQGLGGALLDLVITRATVAGFLRLHADVLAENAVVQALLKSRGFHFTRVSWGVREFERSLTHLDNQEERHVSA